MLSYILTISKKDNNSKEKFNSNKINNINIYNISIKLNPLLYLYSLCFFHNLFITISFS